MADSEPETRVFFDGACPLCRAEIDIYRKRDKAGTLQLVDVSGVAPDLPAGLDRERANARFHVLTRDGELLSGAAAFAEIWRQLPGWRWAGRLAELPGAMPVLEAAYRGFLVMRPLMVRLYVVLHARRRITRDPRRQFPRNKA